MAETKQVQVKLEDVAFSLTGANVQFTEEEFLLVAISGNMARRYVLSPRHAKRLMLLLQKQVQAYEEEFGKLKTSLPEAKGQSTENKKFGF